MILNEIISDYTDDNDTTTVIPNWEATDNTVPAGIKYIKLPSMFQKEELDIIHQRGITPVSIIPVFYAFLLMKTHRSNSEQYNRMLQLMDALKKRNRQHVIVNDDSYKQIHTNAVNRLLGKSSRNWLSQVPANERTDLANKMLTLQKTLQQNKKDVIVVPMASSSAAASEFANELVSHLGLHSKPLNLLIKNHWPTQSSHVRTKTGFTPRSNTNQNWDNYRHEIEQRIEAIDDQLTAINRLDPKSEVDVSKVIDAIDDLEHERNHLQNKLNTHKFEIKSAGHGQSDHHRGYYNYQQLDDEKIDQAVSLSNKIVVLVDDNVDSGATIADAAKSLYRAGITPRQIIGVAVHYFKPPTTTETPS